LGEEDVLRKLSMTPNDIPIREPDQIRQDCPRKLRAVKVSDHFQAILGCLLGEDWTTPRLIEMGITPDGHILGRCDGNASFRAFLGASEDLIRNIHGVAPVAELDGDEGGFLVAKVAELKRQR
jgi:hypothetical protein